MSLPSKFIRAGEQFTDFDNFVPAPYFRKSFKSEGGNAKITIGACGFYELFFNGEKITKGFLAPYISNPDHIVYFDEYDVTLSQGENVIGVILGNGFKNNLGGYVWDFDKAAFRGAPQFAMSVSKDGDTVLESDTTFKTAPSPIIFDDYRFGEHYDANREIPGWCSSGFDDSGWKNAETAPAAKGELRLCEAEPIVKKNEFKAVSIKKVKDGFVYDFGINTTGLCRLNIKGAAKGQEITMRFGEGLTPDGTPDLIRLWCDRSGFAADLYHKDVYICKGEAEEAYTPSFTYHGFQYVYVTGITDEQATENLLTFIQFYSDVKMCGGFLTSKKEITALQAATVLSDVSNLHYFPTDCPHREKNGWTADAAFSAEQYILNLTAQKSFREWMRNICKAQNAEGAIPGIVPTGGWGFAWGNGPSWDSVIAFLPLANYVYRGDKEIIKIVAPTYIKYLKYLETVKDKDGLLELGLGDWAHVGRNAEDFKAPLKVTATIMAKFIADTAAFLLNEIGLEEESAFAKEFSNTIKAAARRHLIDFNTFTVLGDCQSSQAMAIYYDIFEENEKQRAFDRLIELIEKENNRMDTGVVGGRILFDTLSLFGRQDLALKMILGPEFPSYGYWLLKGATTLWEGFKENDDVVSSKNHHFWGFISAWFIKNLAGINYNPTGKNLKEVNICPNFLNELNDAEGFFDSNFGVVSSKWVRSNEFITLTVNVPDSFLGKISLPKGFAFENGEAFIPVSNGTFKIVKK